MQLTAKRLSAVCLCLCVLAGCARGTAEEVSASVDESNATAGPNDDETDAGKGGKTDGGPSKKDAGPTSKDAGNGSKDAGKDSGMSKIDSGAGTPDAGPAVQCPDTLTCANATALGQIDASDSAGVITRQGKGSGWFAVDLKDGNINATGNTKIGVGVTLTASGGSTYSVTLMGDTSPAGGGRCVAANVTDTDPLDKTAIWGSYGPTSASLRVLAVHVQHVSGPCDGAWTLTIKGNPCPVFTAGFGQNALGSCP